MYKKAFSVKAYNRLGIFGYAIVNYRRDTLWKKNRRYLVPTVVIKVRLQYKKKTQKHK
jgi:hypothetical protein